MRRFSRLVLISVAMVWALTWSAFVIASVIGEPWRGWVIGAAFCLGVWSLAIGAWRMPRLGGLAMAAAGLWAWGFFHSRAALVGLSMPALVLGLGFVWLGVAEARRRRRAGRAVHSATPDAGVDAPEAAPAGGERG
ncbi:MAG: hypothetical protein ACF8R9_15450 [Phycisphaerales bacterium JB054]